MTGGFIVLWHRAAPLVVSPRLSSRVFFAQIEAGLTGRRTVRRGDGFERFKPEQVPTLHVRTSRVSKFADGIILVLSARTPRGCQPPVMVLANRLGHLMTWHNVE
jgi:hypothetical protein